MIYSKVRVFEKTSILSFKNQTNNGKDNFIHTSELSFNSADELRQ